MTHAGVHNNSPRELRAFETMAAVLNLRMRRAQTMAGCARETPDQLVQKPHAFSDAVLVVEGRKLYTSKYLLAIVSPFFRAMLTRADHQPEVASIEVTLTGRRYEDVMEMLLHVYPSLRRPITVEKAPSLYSLFHHLQMEREQQRCLAVMMEELRSREIDQMDAQSAAFHRACVEVACAHCLSELYNACVDVAIDHPATHFDALLANMADAPEICLQIFGTKMKRVAYEHRNKRPFRDRHIRQCDVSTDPSTGVDYIQGSSEKVPLGF